jgi:hypothetical protein
MNKHLNLFRTFNLQQSQEYIENNLSRAFVLCLQNDNLLFHEFLKGALDADDYERVFGFSQEGGEITAELQQSISNIKTAEYSKIYGLTLTVDELDLDGFRDMSFNKTKNYKPITDITIDVNGEVLLVIEVKRTNEDCRQQLFNQLYQLKSALQDVDIEDHPLFKEKALSWKSMLKTVVSVRNFERHNGQENKFLSDFIDIVKEYRSSWMPITPIVYLNESDEHGRQLRLDTAITSARKGLGDFPYKDRQGFYLNEPWAREILYWFSNGDAGPHLVIGIWPGNTKGQGWSLYKKKMDWRIKKTISIQGKNYPLHNQYYLSFSSFQRYFTHIECTDEELRTNKELCNYDTFYNYSGRVKREKWPRLAKFFDETFKPEFEWRKKCGWNEKIEKSGKSQFDIAFGFMVHIIIPFKDLQEIDNEIEDGKGLNKFVIDAYMAFKTLNHLTQKVS